MKNKVIAIDGPAGSGKSSTAKKVAQELNFRFFDTGAIYRSITYYCMQHQVPLDDEMCVVFAVKQFCDEKPLEISLDVNNQKQILLGEDISEIIRTPEVTKNIHYISTNLQAREQIVEMQKNIIEQNKDDGIVVEGRDATDVLCQNASVKILLTASEEVRAKRRNMEIKAPQLSSQKDQSSDVKQVLEDLKKRDQKDATINNFMSNKDGATTIDNSDLTFEETVNKIIDIYNKNQTQGD